MANSDVIWVKLGQPYLFTKAQYEYCKSRGAPIAVVYYDTKTSSASKSLYDAVFGSKTETQALYKRLTQEKKYQKGYCCLFVLDRAGRIDGGDPDLDFFAEEVLRSDCSYGKSYQFPVLAMSFKGVACCAELPAAAGADDLAVAIYDACESGECGLAGFANWAGRADWLDRQPKKPPAETAPDKTGKENLVTGITSVGGPAYWLDVPAKKSYADYDPNYDGSFSGISETMRSDQTCALDLADVATPDTTYVLIGSYDIHNKTQCPLDSQTKFKPYVQPYTDHLVEVWNGDCTKKDGGYSDLFKKGAKYRFFVFYEFSHGYEKAEPDGHHEITIGVSYADIWKTFSAMKPYQRVWGQFDSCYSGSVIVHTGATPQPLAASSAPAGDQHVSDILEYIGAKLQRRATLMQAVTGGQVTAEQASNTYDARMVLWSSTTATTHGWYNPRSNTIYMQGFGRAMAAAWWDKRTYGEIRYGTADDKAPT